MSALIGQEMTGGYGSGADILHSCTIGVEAGEVAVIVGPNGAGKSTAMKAVFGMLQLRQGKVVMNGTRNPSATVHVLSGNGGPPSPTQCVQYCGDGGGARDWAGCKVCIQQPYSYTRLTAHNATDLLWEQVSNADSSIIDSWVLHRDKHGAFPAPPTPPPSPVPPSTVCGRQPAPVGCNCTGTVYFGARFVSGTPGSGAENTFAQMLDSPYLTKQVAGSIQCTSQAFGSDPDGGRYKMCFCVT